MILAILEDRQRSSDRFPDLKLLVVVIFKPFSRLFRLRGSFNKQFICLIRCLLDVAEMIVKKFARPLANIFLGCQISADH